MEQTEIPVKVYQTLERITLAAPLPGLEPQDISVQVTEGRGLLIETKPRGIFKGSKEVLRDEWAAGPYMRQLVLPVNVNAEMANLTYENGVMVLSLPISEMQVPATLELQRVGRTLGQRIGNAGHPVRATSFNEHYSLKNGSRQ